VSTAGVGVTASVASGAGSLLGASSATTNASGLATFADLAIGGKAGPQTLTFSSPGLSPVSIAVTLAAGAPATLSAVDATPQTALVGTAVATPPSVTITDADANPVAGVPVTFTVSAGGGSVSSANAVTNAAGVATVVAWTLGATAGTNALTATAAGLTPVTFSATGRAAPAKALTSFAILRSVNGGAVDADVTISGSAVSAFLPPGTDRTKLKASFTVSPDATVSVNGVAQTSGVTANDFTNPVTYVVRAADGSTASYAVTLTTDIASIDQVVSAFMAKYSVPGLSLVITADENLVYAKAYGRADDTHAAKTTDLYRIASLSKQITSVAIMRLLDQDRISLDQKVFGAGGILGTTYGTQPYGAGVTDITVDELLHHTSGGWPNDGSDPMFTNPSMTAAQLISWTLDSRPLSHTPGTAYAYSNFGYCVLGRVIEKITGVSYADAVNALVLRPAGVGTMQIGGSTLASRALDEVQYYGQNGENPYVFNIPRMDAHGGWIASATDLARILVRVDGSSKKADILSSSAIKTMTTASAANASYADGWSVNGPNWWHTGSLPGTATEQARTTSRGNYNFVILTNTRSSSPTFVSDLDALFWSALAATSRWPSYDLF
jgi:CubicO group peptidase (beta-lactamase class C family)